VSLHYDSDTKEKKAHNAPRSNIFFKLIFKLIATQ